jgi:hypothetical protein
MKIREKMIALIYLVLIALMVINLEDKSYSPNLNKFYEDLELSIFFIDQKNKRSYQKIEKNSIETNEAKNKIIYEKSKQINFLVEGIFSSLEILKKKNKENKDLEKKLCFQNN